MTLSHNLTSSPVLVELQYLPPIDYFVLLMQSEKIFLESQEHFVKQSYRNRAYILGANGKLSLTVPVVKGSQKTKIMEVKIDYSFDWHRQHWQSIQSAYGKSPFFEFFADYFRPLYQNPPELLWQLNSELLTICQKILGVNTQTATTKSFDKLPKPPTIDMRNSIHPKKTAIFAYSSYIQVFGNKFENNLSILDLIFNEGRNAQALLLQASEK